MVDKRWITINTSISADGLGTPVVSLYFSYCDKKEITGSFCENCQNSELQKDGVGFLLSLEEIFEIINKKYNFMVGIYGKCEVALIGGDPMAEINIKFAQEIGKKYDSIIYTWRTLEYLEDIDVSMFNRIVCGKYIDKLNVGDDYLLGSTNQYIINGKKEIILKYEGGIDE